MLVKFTKCLFTNIQKQYNMLKISLLFNKYTNFTGEYLENSQYTECIFFRVLLLYEIEYIGRFSNLHLCTFKLSSSSERDNVIQKGEVMFKKNHTFGLSEGLSEASRLIDSAISKRQGDQRKRSFLEKKKLHTRENGFTMNTQKYRIT